MCGIAKVNKRILITVQRLIFLCIFTLKYKPTTNNYMETTRWVYFFPYANLFFSFLVAYFLARKKHIGFWYSFLWGIGFTFIFSWIVTAIATPLSEEYKKSKRDIYKVVG